MDRAGLTPVLAGMMAKHSPVLLAHDSSRGWLLMEDLGEKLRLRINGVQDLTLWYEVLDLYAEL
jgi:aminoglycoside/choline kinase family phosphotransferase